MSQIWKPTLVFNIWSTFSDREKGLLQFDEVLHTYFIYIVFIVIYSMYIFIHSIYIICYLL